MKSRFRLFLALTLCVCLLMGCAATGPATSPDASPSPGVGNTGNAGKETPSAPTPAPTLEQTPVATPLSRIPNDEIEYPDDLMDEFMAKVAFSTQMGEDREIDVPVYYLDSIVSQGIDDEVMVILFGRDNGYSTKHFADRDHGLLQKIIRRLPTDAIRSMEGGKYIYIMYDTDQGQRAYLFFNYNENSEQYMPMAGVPVLMAKKLSYDDYAGVEKGMDVKELADIDPIMAIYSDYFENVFWNRPVESWAKPVETVSILSDGALRITYKRVDGNYFVETVEFSEDFTFEGYYETICYRIAEVDYKD